MQATQHNQAHNLDLGYSAAQPVNQSRSLTPTWPRTPSNPVLSPFDQPSRMTNLPKSSPTVNGSCSSLPSSNDNPPSTSHFRRSSASIRRRSGRVRKPDAKASTTSSPVLTHKKPALHCPFCWELQILAAISRKADLKRHFKQFHHSNKQWICQERGCGMAFDWRSALEAHMRDVHGNVQHPSESHMVKVCPQVVFACGFSNCRLVFEAASDEDADKKAADYFNHVAKHFDDNLTHENWSHTVRIRNLMRQTAVDMHWKDRKKGSQDPKWQPHTSSVVRKILETRHFVDIPLLVQWAVYIGSDPYCEPRSPLPRLPAELQLPVKDSCTLDLAGHRPTVRRDSIRHLSMDYATAQPSEPMEPDVDGQELISDVSYLPSTTSQRHSGSMLSPFASKTQYSPFSQGHFLDQPNEAGSQLSPSSSSSPPSAVATISAEPPPLTDAQLVTAWVEMTDAHLNTVIRYPHGEHPMLLGPERYMTSRHQMRLSDANPTAMLHHHQQSSTIDPMDLGMSDYPCQF